MSRVGKYPVALPQGVTIEVKGEQIVCKGKLGTLTTDIAPEVVAEVKDNAIHFTPINKTAKARALWGTARANVKNMVVGVSEGFKRVLEIEGVGFRAAVQGKEVVMQLGFSHEIRYAIPAGIDVKADKPTQLTVSGFDRQQVGQVAAELRSFKKPEPYKGKGIKYSGEKILRKEGKKK